MLHFFRRLALSYVLLQVNCDTKNNVHVKTKGKWELWSLRMRRENNKKSIKFSQNANPVDWGRLSDSRKS